MRNKRDLAQRRQQANPYKLETKNWKNIIYVGIIVLCTTGTLWLCFYHPFFQIKHIDISGTERLNKEEIHTAVEGIIYYNILFLFPQKSYFLLDVDDVRDILLERLPIDHIRVVKEFPGTIHIEISEKISTIIYDDGAQYSYIDMSGYLVESIRKVGDDEWLIEKEMVTSTSETGEEFREERILSKTHIIPTKQIITEMGEYPIIYDARTDKKIDNTKVLPEEITQGTMEWYSRIGQTDIPFHYIEIQTQLGEGRLYTKEGWYADIFLDKDIDGQFNTLLFLLDEKIDRTQLNYIDLRFGDRVFWQ